ncbi:MAG: hypothetical protein U0Q14_06185 [Dermatophilaceae bacterium]
MSTQHFRPLAYCVTAVLLTACSGASAPTRDHSSTAAVPTSSHATTRVASSVTTSPSTTTTSELGQRFPNTEAGAEAFAKEYLTVLNSVHDTGMVGSLAAYSTPECSRCDGWLKYFQDVQSKNHHGVGTFIVVREITTALSRPGIATAVARITVPEAKIVDQTGKTVFLRKAEGNVTATFFLRYDTQWRVVGSRVE